MTSLKHRMNRAGFYTASLEHRMNCAGSCTRARGSARTWCGALRGPPGTGASAASPGSPSLHDTSILCLTLRCVFLAGAHKNVFGSFCCVEKPLGGWLGSRLPRRSRAEWVCSWETPQCVTGIQNHLTQKSKSQQEHHLTSKGASTFLLALGNPLPPIARAEPTTGGAVAEVLCSVRVCRLKNLASMLEIKLSAK